MAALPDSHLIAQLVEQHRSLSSIARELGVDAHRLSIRCRLIGIPFTPRARLLDNSQLQAVLRLLEEGRRPTEVARLTRVSTATVYRILGASPEPHLGIRRAATSKQTAAAKRHWIALCRKHPMEGVTSLRAKAPTVYAQLHRNAHAWLAQHSPKHARAARRSGSKRSFHLTRTLSLAASLAATDCNRGNRPPQRRSRYRLQQKLGISEYALASTELGANSASLTQSRGEAIANRVDWAGRRLPTGLASPAWQLGKVAGLRSITVEMELKRRRGDGS
ncbi:TnsD family Tn7-like transposition protein [Paraburkholderia sp. MPAMCS5]|uniref:TnsD family Tn7-like transposition protein n=1 Tax=Paraburkholderia sp. MPAMCS5 TaxID=3112563 RepID=UPI003FA727B8